MFRDLILISLVCEPCVVFVRGWPPGWKTPHSAGRLPWGPLSWCSYLPSPVSGRVSALHAYVCQTHATLSSSPCQLCHPSALAKCAAPRKRISLGQKSPFLTHLPFALPKSEGHVNPFPRIIPFNSISNVSNVRLSPTLFIRFEFKL